MYIMSTQLRSWQSLKVCDLGSDRHIYASADHAGRAGGLAGVGVRRCQAFGATWPAPGPMTCQSDDMKVPPEFA